MLKRAIIPICCISLIKRNKMSRLISLHCLMANKFNFCFPAKNKMRTFIISFWLVLSGGHNYIFIFFLHLHFKMILSCKCDWSESCSFSEEKKGSGRKKDKDVIGIIVFCVQKYLQQSHNNILVFQILAIQQHYINTVNNLTKCYKALLIEMLRSVSNS